MGALINDLPLGVLVAAILVLVVVLLLIIRAVKKSQRVFRPALLEKWGKSAPTAATLVACFSEMTEEDRQDVATLAVQNGWWQGYLAALGSDEAVPTVVREFFSYCAADAQQELLQQLVQKLAAAEQNASMAAVELLWELHDLRILPHLLAAVLQPADFLPARVSEVLVRYGEPAGEALAALYQQIGDRPDCQVKILGIVAEMQENCPRALLETAMHESNEEVQLAAAQAVGMAKPPQPVRLVQPLLQAPNAKVRAAAADSLGKISGGECISALREQMLHDEDWRVRSTCQTYIGRWEEDIKNNLLVDEADLWLKNTQQQ